MKDIHGERSAPGRIILVSPALHCVAMTALVYLRSSFGFTLFRPRSIFFAFSFAAAILDYIAWHEPELWREYHAVCIFSGGAVTLYWFHFAVTVTREVRRKSERDDYSGTSHALRVVKQLGISRPGAEASLHLWFEPAAVLIFAAVLRFALDERHLSAWLAIVAPCMFAKEALNCWTEIRREKIAKDVTSEAEELGQALGGETATPEAPHATRVAAQKIKRNPRFNEEEARAKRFAAALGITEPYDLEEVETNYRDRIRCDHPDNHENSPESNQRTAELNEAVEFFRKKLGG